MPEEKSPFEILQIEATDDVKQIKKAYAGLTKKYHPEDDKEKWLILHNAYRQALEYAKCNEKPAQMQKGSSRKVKDPISPAEEKREQNTGQELRDEELEELIEQITKSKGCLSSKVSGRDEEAFLQAFRWLDKMEKEHGGLYMKWAEFFQSETYKRVRLNEQFLFGLGRMIGDIKIDGSTERILRQETEKIRVRLNDDIDANQTGYRPEVIKYLESKIDIASRRYKREMQDSNTTVLALIFIAFNLCPIGILILMWICSKLLPWLDRLL